jgi:hypothetical protein
MCGDMSQTAGPAQVLTVHLVQFVIQTKKCTTHAYRDTNKNIGIKPKRQSRLYTQPSLQLPCTVITTDDTTHSVL